MNVHPDPIGMFDSGIGGLSVLVEIRRLLPSESYLYAADSRFCPYGTRPEAEIRGRCLAIGTELVARGARLLVVACNTASSVALEDLRARLPVPVVGLEPAVKPAAARTRTGRIAVLTTPRTAAGDRLKRLIDAHGTAIDVRVVVAPELVEFVEAGELEGPRVEAAISGLVDPLLAGGVDTIVLGCTHFPFLRRSIRRVVGPEVEVIDSGRAVARRTRQLLEGPASSSHGSGSLRVLTTGDRGRTATIASRLLGQEVSVERAPV